MSGNRIEQTSTATEAKTEPNILKPAAGAVLPQPVIIVLTVLVAVAGVLPLIPGLPPVAIAIAGVVTAVGVAFGIASPGIRRQPPS
jgi:hypothetical protein